MTWKDINVFQWQRIISAYDNRGDLTNDDLYFKLLGIINNMTEAEMDALSIEQMKPLIRSGKFLHEELKPEAKPYIKINGKRYRCVYDIKKLPAARYIETKHFQKDVNANMHRIAACMVIPQKRNWFGMWVDDKYDATMHESYSQDMLEAKITDVLGSVVFFYHVYHTWIKISKDYLILEMMEKGMSKKTAEAMYRTLCKSMDGFIKSSWLPTTKPSVLKMLTNYAHYNFLMTFPTSKQKVNTKNNN